MVRTKNTSKQRQIPKELIWITPPYYSAYLEMVAKHDHKMHQCLLSNPILTAITAKAVKGNQPSLLPVRRWQRSTQTKEEKYNGPILTLEGTSVTEEVGDINWTHCTTWDDTSRNIIRATLKETAEIDEGQAGSDPGKTPESRPPPERVLMEEDQARPNPGQILSHKFMKSLKHPTEESCSTWRMLSASGTISSMKNYEDNFTFGGSLINDNSNERRSGDRLEADMKEILHQRMFESGSYKSHPDHKALYEALEVSWKSFCHIVVASFQLLKQKPGSLLNNIDDIPIPDDMHLSDSEDTGADHLPKIKTRPDWLKYP
ncbi:hypothetical protein Tco_1091408 [Tanacetum coccineum]|uniref:Uncharacterized protein n=1 Tax=Tanacetum coccineum TaxID=301880 RepID=A0ABQ5I748_9ASTR